MGTKRLGKGRVKDTDLFALINWRILAFCPAYGTYQLRLSAHMEDTFLVIVYGKSAEFLNVAHNP